MKERFYIPGVGLVTIERGEPADVKPTKTIRQKRLIVDMENEYYHVGDIIQGWTVTHITINIPLLCREVWLEKEVEYEEAQEK